MIAPEVRQRFESKYVRVPEAGCWIWEAGMFSSGYGQFKVAGRPTYAHRTSWEMHCGPIPDGLIVCHRCDVPACCNPSHLFLGTYADNAADRNRKGRQARNRGERAGGVKLTADRVAALRARAGMSRPERLSLAREWGVTERHLRKICSGERWLKEGNA